MPDTSQRPRIVPVAFGKTDVGRQREHNEDQFLVLPEIGLFVVCDGMGGNNAGEVASALATTSLRNFYQATEAGGPVPGKLRKEDESLTDSERRLVLGVRKANADVYEISSTRIEHQGMGSTIVAMHVSKGSSQIEIAHIGDSRCYRIRDAKIQQLTRDHSLIGDALAWNPNLSEEELSRLPKNIISRALGLKRYVEVDVKSEAALPGDIYLLCSDGLSGMVKDAQILDLFLLSDDLQEACENLIAVANEAGGSDNITAVAIRMEPDTHAEQGDPASDSTPKLQIELEPEDHESAADAGDEETDPDLDSSPPAPEAPTTPAIRAATPVAVAPDISASPLAVDELLSYLDDVPEDGQTNGLGASDELITNGAHDTRTNGAPVRCESCGDIPTPGDLFCGHCGARIAP
jgi:protein phosphatase